MGQRGSSAAFMPDKVVFPGGAVDPEDSGLPFEAPLPPDTARRLAAHADPALVIPIALAAIRELWEETGVRLAHPDPVPRPALPPSWQGFAAGGFRPRTEDLRLVFRAVTPPGRPRRFDARFFLVDAAALASPPDDFTLASGELSGLRWVDLTVAGSLPLPFITGIVLSEIAALLADPDTDRPVPFFDNRDGSSRFHSL